MEIERKFIPKYLPDCLATCDYHTIEQGYLCTSPVVRIRKCDNEYYLTYKSKGMMAREEYNLPLTQEAYLHLLDKCDGNIIRKNRYLIPLNNNLTAELDIFDGVFAGMLLVEVEFSSVEDANSFSPPDWFGEDVTYDGRYHNSYLSKLNK